MIQKIKLLFLKQKAKKPNQYKIDGKTFVIDKITVGQYAKLVKLIDKILLSAPKEEAGLLNIVADVVLHFEKLAAIVFENQPGSDQIKWNEIDGALAWDITEAVLKKNPKLMIYVQNIFGNLGLSVKPLAQHLKKIMQLK